MRTRTTDTYETSRREVMKNLALGALVAGSSGAALTGTLASSARAAEPAPIKMAFIQFQPHTVSSAWAKGIQDVLSIQPKFGFQLLDGQAKADIQISLMDTVINDGVNVIFVQPVDSVGIGPSIKKAARKGIPVITLNIDSTAKHAAHIEMNHYFGAMEIANAMGTMIGGKGKVAILNAPPGIIIRDQRTNGFVDGMKKYHPDVQIVADQVADWDRKKAQDVLSTILTAHPDLGGVYGVNDSMALGAMDVAKSKGIKLVIFGNDGEKDALEAIEAGDLAGTQYTDVFQQGRFAAAVATVLATGGVQASAFAEQGHLLMPYVIATKETVGTIQTYQRW
ncbi:MAG: sugar ABC transporter substrate-binding protein [Methylobacteriaceae bacterium]|nr:sugar ABC transporter substrate-binding protein [Methylobacteriaceae bacterium]